MSRYKETLMKRILSGLPVWARIALFICAAAVIVCWALWGPSGLGDIPEPGAGGRLEVYFLDVGQADSIFIRQGTHTLLIDAGTNKAAGGLVQELKELGVTALDILIGTHPHEDHIGGLDKVIDAFEIGTVIMPKIEHDTQTFRDVLTALENKSLTVTAPKAGSAYTVGDAVLTILWDEIDAKNLNNCSVVTRLDYGGAGLLLTGDAEKEAEDKLLENGVTLRADFLKVGHHGSNTSTTDVFLDAVSPKEAFISCGTGNSYGHPKPETLQKLEKRNIMIHRTDVSGTITLFVRPDGTYTVDYEK